MAYFTRRHPAAVILYFAAVFIVNMLTCHPAFICVSFISAFLFLLNLNGRAAVRFTFCRIMPLYAFAVLLGFLISSYGETALVTLNSGRALTLEALAGGAVMGGVAACLIMWFACAAKAVTFDKFSEVFGRFMPKGALLVSMILRFAPLYSAQLAETTAARQAAGLGGGEGFAEKLKNSAAALSGVVTFSLEKSIDTSDSMRARGFGLKGKTSYSRFHFSVADAVLSVLSALFLIAGAVPLISGAAEFSYNPVISLPPAGFAFRIALACYSLLCLLPLAFEGVQAARFRKAVKSIE